MSEHDKLVDIVKRELINRGYEKIYDHIEYTRKNSGEIDLYARKNNYILLFEIKCNKNKKSYEKAINQLYRAEKYYFKKKHRVFKFLVYDIKEPKIEWIR
jgi:Holliday junction resolvase-like predicted endonuclease